MAIRPYAFNLQKVACPLFLHSIMDKESVKSDADAIGIVFPVYHGDIPFIIRRFVTKMNNLDKKYIFGVCTYGNSPEFSIKYLDKIIKSYSGKLAAGFAVSGKPTVDRLWLQM